MMTIVERVARAIDPDAWEPLEGDHPEEIRRFLDHIGEKRQERALIDALAALRALREPTPAMFDATQWSDACAAEVWRDMISAAIHEAETV